MLITHRAILLAALPALLILSACDKIVELNANQNDSYVIKGDARSDLYPLDLKRDGEDVRIRLKKSVPTPEIVSLDPAGHALPFYFNMDGDTLIVPGKFDRIVLRRPGIEPIEIIKQSAH